MKISAQEFRRSLLLTYQISLRSPSREATSVVLDTANWVPLMPEPPRRGYIPGSLESRRSPTDVLQVHGGQDNQPLHPHANPDIRVVAFKLKQGVQARHE